MSAALTKLEPLVCRFAVIENGQQYSMQWRISTSGYNLIAAPRNYANYGKKVNFHFKQNDNYAHFTTKEYDAQLVTGSEVTPLDCLSWHKQPTLPFGEKMAHLMSVILPNEMTQPKPYKSGAKKEVYELPRPGPMKSWIVSVNLTAPPPPGITLGSDETDDYKVLATSHFLPNEIVVILAQRVPFDAVAFWKNHEDAINNNAKTKQWITPPEEIGDNYLTCHLWNNPSQEGYLKIWEIGGLKLRPAIPC